MRRQHFRALGDSKARHPGADDEGRDFCTAIVARSGARKHGIEIRDPGVRDESFVPIDDVSIPFAAGHGFQRGYIRSGIRLSQSKSTDRLSICRPAQPEVSDMLGRRQTDRIGAEPLHHKG